LNYKSRRNRLLNIVTFGLAGKIARKAELYADAMLCESCHFYSIWNRIPNESLDALYIDYRAADYDSDREQYEPGYIKNISDKIGKQEEAKSRLVHQAEYFKVIESAGVFKASDVRCALDWGGQMADFFLGLSRVQKDLFMKYRISSQSVMWFP